MFSRPIFSFSYLFQCSEMNTVWIGYTELELTRHSEQCSMKHDH